MTVTFRQLLLANESTRKRLLATIQPRKEEEIEQDRPTDAVDIVPTTSLVHEPIISPTHNIDPVPAPDPSILDNPTDIATTTIEIPITDTATADIEIPTATECVTLSDTCYEVEAIVDSRFNPSRQRKEFLVKWSGYPPIWNSWEPEEHLQCPGLMEEFLQRHVDSRFLQVSAGGCLDHPRGEPRC